MSLPELLAERVGDESVVAEVPLGGDDRLAVTPTRTLVYRGDGLLSDETVAEYPHDVERIAVSTGRRKAKLTLGYGLDGDETISVPVKRADDVVHPVLAGVLSARGVTGSGESVVRTFRFSELTLVVTSDRLVKHVGSAVWDDEFEEFAYADLTDLNFEEGTVATAVVLTHGGRSERFKAPNESARALRETLVDAVCAFHGVDSLEEFRVAVTADDDGDARADEVGMTGGTTDFGEGPDPLSASPVADAEADAEVDSPDPEPEAGPSGTEPAASAGTESDVSGGTAESDAGSTSEAGAKTDPVAPVEADALADSGVASGTAPGGDASGDGTRSGGGSTAAAAGETDPLSTGVGDGETAASGSNAAVSDDGVDGSGGAPADPSSDADGFDGSPFETAGVEGEDLATEVAELRHTVEAQSERLDRQSALIEQLIEELRRGR